MRRGIPLTIFLVVTSWAHGFTTHLSLDNTDVNGVRCLAPGETLNVVWDSAWYGDDASRFELSVDGAVVRKGPGAGVYAYSPDDLFTEHTLRYAYAGESYVVKVSVTKLALGEVVDGAAVIPEGYLAIDPRAFAGRSDLHFVSIPFYVGIIDDDAFAGCANLTTVMLDSAGGLARFADAFPPTVQTVTASGIGLPFDFFDGVSATVIRRVVTGVTARQRYPWNGLVDITVTMRGQEDALSAYVCAFSATNSATGTVIPFSHLEEQKLTKGDGAEWKRKYVWDSAADVGEVKIDDIALTVEAGLEVQLWENGPYWATCNVGATKPEECGYYFWWGDTVGYRREGDSWNAVDGSRTGFSFESSNCPTYGKSLSQLRLAGYTDSTGNLTAAYDAATAHLGAPWRMPTDAEWGALINNCTTTWTTRNGVRGRLVTGKGAYASRSIFLPEAGDGYGTNLNNIGSGGYYWSSAPHSDYSYDAWSLSFGSSYLNRYYRNRFYGQSVRPIRGFAE